MRECLAFEACRAIDAWHSAQRVEPTKRAGSGSSGWSIKNEPDGFVSVPVTFRFATVAPPIDAVLMVVIPDVESTLKRFPKKLVTVKAPPGGTNTPFWKVPIPVERWFHETDASVVADLGPFRKWLERYRPEVVIAKAAYVLPLFKAMGLRIPQDMAFANLFLDQPDGAMAGVRQNHDMVGAAAVGIVASQLQHYKFGVPTVPLKTYVDGTWFDGASCPPRLIAGSPKGRRVRKGGKAVR